LDSKNAKAPHCSFIENQGCNFGFTFEMANSKGGPAMFGSKWHLSRNAHLPKRRSQRGYKESSKTLFGIFRKKNWDFAIQRAPLIGLDKKRGEQNGARVHQNQRAGFRNGKIASRRCI
jgi:hypothetical protein